MPIWPFLVGAAAGVVAWNILGWLLSKKEPTPVNARMINAHKDMATGMWEYVWMCEVCEEKWVHSYTHALGESDGYRVWICNRCGNKNSLADIYTRTREYELSQRKADPIGDGMETD